MHTRNFSNLMSTLTKDSLSTFSVSVFFKWTLELTKKTIHKFSPFHSSFSAITEDKWT